MKQSQAEPTWLPQADTQVPQGLELRHLRYFVAFADAGTFTDAAEQMFIAQPTLSQQIRRLEQIVGTPLLHRGRDGVQLTTAGAVLLDASRDVLSLVDHGVNHTRQAAGLGRQRLRMVGAAAPARCTRGGTASRLLLGGCRCQRRPDLGRDPAGQRILADLPAQGRRRAGLAARRGEDLPAPLDVMRLGEFEPVLWIPSWHPAARRGTLTVEELTRMTVVYGPRRADVGTYDQWLECCGRRIRVSRSPTRCSVTRCPCLWPSPPPRAALPRC